MPTLLMSTPTSSAPILALTAARAFASKLEKSTARCAASKPFALSSCSTVTSLSSEREMRKILRPCRASSNAYALPIPSVAPVMTAHSPYLRSFLPGRSRNAYSVCSTRSATSGATTYVSASATETFARASIRATMGKSAWIGAGRGA